MTQSEIWLRRLLTVGGAALGYLVASEVWGELVGKYGLMVTGLLLVIFQSWRAFEDKSTSQGESAEPTKVTVENTPDAPVPTESVTDEPVADVDEGEPTTAPDHGV